MLSLRSFDARQVMFPPRGRILTLFHVQLALQARIARRSSTHFHLAVTCRGLPLPCCGGPVLKRMWSDRKGRDPGILQRPDAFSRTEPASRLQTVQCPRIPLRRVNIRLRHFLSAPLNGEFWLRTDRSEEIRASAI